MNSEDKIVAYVVTVLGTVLIATLVTLHVWVNVTPLRMAEKGYCWQPTSPNLTQAYAYSPCK